jgi:hypothetical protein
VLFNIEKILQANKSELKKIPPEVEWVYGTELSTEKIQSLKNQHSKLSNAFQSLYVWSTPALALVYKDVNPIRLKMKEAGCNGPVFNVLDNLELNVSQQGAGTTYCKGRLVAYFLDRNMSMSSWDHILGSEFGGVIQENAAKFGGFVNTSSSNWYQSTPAWYAEGGQTVISVIADSKATGKWNSEINQSTSFKSPYCTEDSLVNFKCVNLLPVVAMELLVGLYGLNAPLAIFENLKENLSNEDLFKKTFGLDFKVFNDWSIEYLRYLQSGKALSKDLISALTK